MLPREEEPQIKVPMIDVLVSMPGFSAKEVEERATRPMEKLLWEIPGVEYIYSTSRPGESLAIVRFKVGEDVEKSLVKLNQKLQSNFDRIPHGVSFPLIKPKSIDDVPILALTFHSARYDHLTLRRLVAQVDDAVKQVPLVAETTLIGGAKRQLRVLAGPDPACLAQPQRGGNRAHAHAGQPAGHRRRADQQQPRSHRRNRRLPVQCAGRGQRGGRRFRRQARLPARGRRDQGRRGGAVAIRLLRRRARQTPAAADEQPAVTLSIAKRPGANAISVAEQVLKKIDALKGRTIPERRADFHHAQLRRDGGGKIQRTAAAHGHRGARRFRC